MTGDGGGPEQGDRCVSVDPDPHYPFTCTGNPYRPLTPFVWGLGASGATSGSRGPVLCQKEPVAPYHYPESRQGRNEDSIRSIK